MGALHRVEPGTLIIGDLSGYTRYLSETEFEHAHAVLDGVFGVLSAALTPAFQLKELEGDAVFVYRLEAQPDPTVLLDGVEQTYFTFRRHMRDVIAATTCECNACRRMPQLDLKFTAHFGSFVVRSGGGPEGHAAAVPMWRAARRPSAPDAADGRTPAARIVARCARASALGPYRSER